MMKRTAGLLALCMVSAAGCALENDLTELSATGEATAEPSLGGGGADAGADAEAPVADEQPADPQQIEDLERLLDMQQNDEGVAAPPRADAELVELGQVLAFDKILSGNRDISCMTCHHPLLSSGDGRNLPIGAGGSGLGPERTHPSGDRIGRHGPVLFNLHDMEQMFWDGRVSDDRRLETPAGGALTAAMEDTFELPAAAAQAMFPVTSDVEMRGMPGDNELADLDADDFAGIWAGLMARLGGIEEYVELFEAAYPGESFEDMTFAHAANAIAAFEVEAFAATDSPWDRFLAGDEDAMSADQVAGAQLFFGRARCSVCHSGSSLTDEDFHNIALPQIGAAEDRGREDVTGDPQDRYAFRTPPLRNVALTGPYGHAGQYATLRDFIAHYNDPGRALRDYDPADHLEVALQGQVLDNDRELLDRLAPQLRGIALSGDDIGLLVAFMEALTDPASEDLTAVIPDRVPSGLPVAD